MLAVLRSGVPAQPRHLRSPSQQLCKTSSRFPVDPRTHYSPRIKQSHLALQSTWKLRSLMAGSGDPPLNGLMGTCALMFLGAYGCGMLPSWVPVSEQRMASVNALGAGLLLGSALVIILPEGFEAATRAAEFEILPEWIVPLSLLAGFWLMLLLDMLSHMLPAASNSSSSHRSLSDPDDGTHRSYDSANDYKEHVILLDEMQQQRPGTPRRSTPAGTQGSGGTAVKDLDKVPAGGSSSSLHRLQGTLDGAVPVESSKVAAVDSRGSLLSRWLKDPSQQALLGLIVHAVSDGLAVGASALSAEPAVSLSVAVAMVVHKGPVAVGLATYLRSAKWTTSSMHKGILLFAAASPVAAVLTYGLLSALPFMSQGGNIPLAVLFSGGTVLYAATMHILPSALGSHGQAHHHVDSLGGAAISEKTSRASPQLMQQRQLIQLLLVSAGMLMPLVLTAVVHHEH